jgi:hypothetical protein
VRAYNPTESDMADTIPQLALPPLFRETLDYLGGLEPSQFDTFMQALEASSPAAPTDDVINALTDALPRTSGRSITSLLEFALSTRRLTSTLKTTARTVSAAVTEAYSRAKSGDDQDSRNQLMVERINALLSSHFVSVRSKTVALSSDTDLRMVDCLCLTDLRPVFAPDGDTDEVSGFVIMHTLKMEVAGSRSEPLYITLDTADLHNLAGAVRRAQDKEAQMTQFLTTAGTRDLTVREVSS